MSNHLPRNLCQYKKHTVELGDMQGIYWDDDNGLPRSGVRICKSCYAEHILKYYPNCRMAQHIKDNRHEFALA